MHVDYNYLLIIGTIKDIKDNIILLEERNKQLVTKRTNYEWDENSHCALPSFVKANPLTLKHDADFEAVKMKDFFFNLAPYAKNKFLECPVERHSSLSMEEYTCLEIKSGEPDLNLSELSRWATDVEFGRQMLNGVNPVVIERCTSLPDNFPVTNDLVQPFLDGGKTLNEEMEVCNYACISY